MSSVERQKKIDKLKREVIQCPSGEVIHVSKMLYDKVMKMRKIYITSVQTIDKKLIINYKASNGSGVLELYDIGPAPIK